MILSTSIDNLGPIRHFKVAQLGNINLVIGPNRSGKTFLLKSLYAATRSIEQYQRGRDTRSINEILFENLYWDFQVEKLGDIVSKGRNKFDMSVTFGAPKKKPETLSFSMTSSTEKKLVNVKLAQFRKTTANSIFIPAKEILTILDIVKRQREEQSEFGFDGSYYDLAKALKPAGMGKNYPEFAQMRSKLNNAIGGKLYFDAEKKRWVFKQGRYEFDINSTSEGTKKLAIFDTLLGNHYLSPESVVFIDEPESGLHPRLISEMMEIIGTLAQAGLQFFIASHSYFVIKKLQLLAENTKVHIPVISFTDNSIDVFDLMEGMPANPIIDESVRLYEEKLDSLPSFEF